LRLLDLKIGHSSAKEGFLLNKVKNIDAINLNNFWKGKRLSWKIDAWWRMYG
jgi:hypothetical protein